MNNYAHLSARVLNTPLLVEPGYARVFFSALAGRLGIHQLADASGEILTGEKLRMSAESFEPARERNRPYQVVGGVGVLPITGSLVHKSGYVQPFSGTTGYDGIIARAAEAFADPDVRGVMMDLDTPGGEVAGCFDTARTLRQLADAAGKPLWALCYDMNCSAGMALASSAHHRLITQTGIAGSIGVVMAHSDYSKMLDESGIKVTLIHSGSHKVAGNPYEALPDEVLQRFQSSTDQLRQEFGQLVSGFTGLSLEAVLATEAATFRGQEAIDVGLADELINGHEAIAYFSDYLSRSGSVSTGATMSTNDATKTTLEQQAPQAGADSSQTLPEIAPAAEGTQQSASQPVQQTVPDPAAAAPQSGATMTAAEMQARISGILSLDEAKAHQDTANHLAFNTQLTVEEAKGILATLPEPSSSGKMETALDRVMDSEEQPNLLADHQAGGDQPQSNALLTDYELATGDK